MKRFFCSAIAGVMLAATLAIPSAAAQSNVDVEALKFTEQPTFDGVISEEEWGAPTITVYGNQAATNDDDSANEYNTYIRYEDTNVFEKMSYTLWLRYDDEYFYVGVKVHDADGHAAPNGGEGIWNNDVVQFRVDPQGPNSAMINKDPNYDYTKTEFDFTKVNYSEQKNRAWKSGAKLLDACFALINGYDPQARDTETPAVLEKALFNSTTVDTGNGETDFSCETTYEIALTWGDIGDKVMGEGYKAKTGDVLGMTLMVRNSCGASYDAILTWGSGLDIEQAKNARKTSGGSNAVTLSEKTVTPAADYPKATEPVPDDTTAPAPVDTDKPADTAKDTSKDTAKPSNNNKPNYNDANKDGSSNTALIIGIVAAVVVVAAVVAVVVVKKKKK